MAYIDIIEYGGLPKNRKEKSFVSIFDTILRTSKYIHASSTGFYHGKKIQLYKKPSYEKDLAEFTVNIISGVPLRLIYDDETSDILMLNGSSIKLITNNKIKPVFGFDLDNPQTKTINSLLSLAEYDELLIYPTSPGWNNERYIKRDMAGRYLQALLDFNIEFIISISDNQCIRIPPSCISNNLLPVIDDHKVNIPSYARTLKIKTKYRK